MLKKTIGVLGIFVALTVLTVAHGAPQVAAKGYDESPKNLELVAAQSAIGKFGGRVRQKKDYLNDECQCPQRRTLRKVSFVNTNLSDEDVIGLVGKIAECLRLPWDNCPPSTSQLLYYELDLSMTKVTDRVLRHVAAIPEINRLDLSHTLVRGEGLADLKPLKKLKSLFLPYNHLSLAAIERFGSEVTPDGELHLYLGRPGR